MFLVLLIGVGVEVGGEDCLVMLFRLRLRRLLEDSQV